MQVYFGDWAEPNTYSGLQGQQAMEADFAIEPLAADIEVLFAEYVDEGYSGDAFVLYRQGDQLYEVHGSHCSCYGLEDQWEPERADLAELVHRNEMWPIGQTLAGEKRLSELLTALFTTRA